MLDMLRCTTTQMLTRGDLCAVQKIKNPDYKGKWKAPMIDNPGICTFQFSKEAISPEAIPAAHFIFYGYYKSLYEFLLI